jgi:predicted transcriptional regulator
MAHPAIQSLNGLDWTDIKLLEELSFLGQDSGYSLPGRQYLSGVVGCSIRTVSRHISKLCRLGFLQRIQRSYRRADGSVVGRSNLYRIACGIGERIKNFFGAVGKRISTPSTGGPRLARLPRRKKNSLIRKGILPQKANTQPLGPEILEKIPLLKRWLERGKDS